MNRQAAWVWLTLTLLLAFGLRVYGLERKSLWYDELRQVEVARGPLADFPRELVRHSGRPLDYVLTHAMLLAGRQEFWLRFPAVVWGTLSVALSFALARRWTGRETALRAAALMAAAPIGIQYSQEMRPYALYLLFTLLSFWTLDRALSERPDALAKGSRAAGLAWLGFGLASAAGTLTHFFYTFVLTVQALFVIGLFGFRKLRWPQVLRFGLSALAGYAALLVAANPFTLTTLARRFLTTLAGLPLQGLVTDTGARLSSPETLSLDFVLTGLLPFYGGGAGAALLVFNGLALAGALALAARKRRLLALLGLWLLLTPALVLVYLQYRQQFFAIRYVIFVLPAYLLLIAHGLALLAHRLPWRRALPAAGLLVLLVFDLNQVAGYYAESKDDWRRVGEFLTANVRAGDAVAAPDVQFFIRFYAPAQTGTIIDANDRGPHEQALENYDRFWFVWSEYTLLPVDEVRQWASDLPGVTIQLDPRIRVIYFHPGRSQAEMLAEAQHFVIPPPSVCAPAECAN